MAEDQGIEPSSVLAMATVFKTVCSHERDLPYLAESVGIEPTQQLIVVLV